MTNPAVKLPAVSEILVVHSVRIRVELLRRGADLSWPPNPTVAEGLGASVELTSIGLQVPLAEIYRDTYLTVLPA